MSEVWVNTALLSTKKVTYNWKIENFGKCLKVFRKIGIDSPGFKLTTHKNEVHLVKIILEEESFSSSLEILEEDGTNRSIKDFTLLKVSIDVADDVEEEPIFSLAGNLDFNLDGKCSFGSFGNPEQDSFINSNTWSFINSSSKIIIKKRSICSTTYTSGFCVAKNAETLQLKVELTTPGHLSSTISLVPNKYTVKETSGSKLIADMKSLLSRADFADFAIICEGKNFPCHEAVLRARSPVFDTMFIQEMKESTTRELIIEDVGEDIIDAFLEYIYTGEITKKVENESGLVYVADKYSVPGLLEVCFHRFPEIKEDMVVDILILADRHNLDDFKKVAIQRVLQDKSKFFSDENFVNKMKMVPNLLVELVKQ